MAKKAKKQTESQSVKRAPIVTVMGHVDHGKTTLLDTLRKTHVADKESGGITQHIGAYQVMIETKEGPRPITFIDTPGHEAFTAMRLRGAKATDIVVLVVAANEGVKPQTIEAVSHAKQAEVPIIVAINKMDLSSADPERVKAELADKAKLKVEGYGGDVVTVPISAKTGQGVDDLLEMINLVSQLQETEDDAGKPSTAMVLEAKQEARQGILVNIILLTGTLQQGDFVATPSAVGKVKRLTNDQGESVKSIIAGQPGEILGFTALPKAGETLQVFDSEKSAQAFVNEQVEEASVTEPVGEELTLEAFFANEGAVKPQLYVLKADVQGSLEAIEATILKLSSPEKPIEIVHQGVGEVTNADLLLARSARAKVLAFRVDVPSSVRAEAKQDGLVIETFDVIYEIVDFVKEQLGVDSEEESGEGKGRAEVIAVFTGTSDKQIAGCRLLQGRIKRGEAMRVLRQDEVVLESRVKTLRHVKETVKIINRVGQEFGLVTKDKDFSFEQGDIVEIA